VKPFRPRSPIWWIQQGVQRVEVPRRVSAGRSAATSGGKTKADDEASWRRASGCLRLQICRRSAADAAGPHISTYSRNNRATAERERQCASISKHAAAHRFLCSKVLIIASGSSAILVIVRRWRSFHGLAQSPHIVTDDS